MHGGPSQLDLFDHKPGLAEAARPGTAGVGARGPAAHRHDERPEVAAGDRRRSSTSRSMAQCGAWVSELLPHTATDRGRAVHHPLDAHRGDQSRSRRSPICKPGISSRAGRASARGPATDWAARTADLPAFVVLHLARQRGAAGRSAVCAAVGLGLSAVEPSGRRVPQRRRSGAVSLESAGRRCGDAPRPARCDRAR